MRRLSIAAAVFALALSACTQVPETFKQAEAVECPSGSDCYDPPRPVGPGGVLLVEAGEFYFEILEGAETVQEGPVEITVDNVGGAEHNLTIDEAFGDPDAVLPDENIPPGETGTATLELFAGSYVYYCSVPGHRQAGMEATLEVSAAGAVTVTPGPTATDGTATDGDELVEEGASPGAAGADQPDSPAPAEPEPEGPADTEGGAGG